MIAPIAAKPVLPRNPRRSELKLFPPFAAFRPVSRAMIFLLLLIARCCGLFWQGFRKDSQTGLSICTLRPCRKVPFVIRTLCQNVAARAQADALNTTRIDARTGEQRPCCSPSTWHERMAFLAIFLRV
jgi:hypothetical protein